MIWHRPILLRIWLQRKRCWMTLMCLDCPRTKRRDADLGANSHNVFVLQFVVYTALLAMFPRPQWSIFWGQQRWRRSSWMPHDFIVVMLVNAQRPSALHTRFLCHMNTPSTIQLVWIYWKSPTLLVRSIRCSIWFVWVLVFNKQKWWRSVQVRLQVETAWTVSFVAG